MSDKKPDDILANSLRGSKRAKLFGLDSDRVIQGFFGGNAFIAIFVLGLITLLLISEGWGFRHQYLDSLKEYRKSGLEYADTINAQMNDMTAIARYLTAIKKKQIDMYDDKLVTPKERNIHLQPHTNYFLEYNSLIRQLRDFYDQKRKIAMAVRDWDEANKNLAEAIQNDLNKAENVAKTNEVSEGNRPELIKMYRDYASDDDALKRVAEQGEKIAQLEKQFRVNADRLEMLNKATADDAHWYVKFLKDRAAQTQKNQIKEYALVEQGDELVKYNYEIMTEEFKASRDDYTALNTRLAKDIQSLIQTPPIFDDPNLTKEQSEELAKMGTRFVELNEQFIETFPSYIERLEGWDPEEPYPPFTALTKFITGADWITASDTQDWYGILPLLSGSMLIGIIALILAVPLGVGAAIYINQIATPAERNFIKPYIEFIEAIPSIVIGLFGIIVLGSFIRAASGWEIFEWVPFFPLRERLMAFTAGCLLALMAIPTIFTLTEDAINNVPRHFKEGSYALGASNWQTTIKIIVPAALSGIISAIMLGFGRVVGETMVVLLCAGNSIQIPDFTEGVGVFFQPVHTLTGIIAQELGEVEHESLHYRALFMVGIFLFFMSLLINYIAQAVVRKFKIDSD